VTAQLPDGASAGWTDFGRWIARYPYALPFRVREHVPLTGGVVVANHSSMADGPLLFGALPRRVAFLVEQGMVAGPPGRFLRKIGRLSVRRCSRR
jgi:1-acyl-sn-glycerol-3-phosphate acyltransferase